jgi:hypothetical protein
MNSLEANMSEKERQKKDHQRKDKKNQAMKEASRPRKQQASIRFGEQKESTADDGRRRGERRN